MLKKIIPNIPFKIILSYLVLVGISGFIAWSLYTDSLAFFKLDEDHETNDKKAFLLSNLLNNISRVERVSRSTAYSNTPEDLVYYQQQNALLLTEIDSVKKAFDGYPQIHLLDSVKQLLVRKTRNIKDIREVRNRYLVENNVRKAIQDMDLLEDRYRKLQLSDFVANPESLNSYQRSVMNQYVQYLNDNIPDDSTNTLTKKQMDSILVSSRQLLSQVRAATALQKKSFEQEEKKLLGIENEITEQINIILKTVEKAISRQNEIRQQQRQERMEQTYSNVSLLAIVGLTLSLIFVLLVVLDFSRSQQYKKQLEIANNQTAALLANREQLISTVSHDLKTPVSTINGYSEILSRAGLSNPQRHYVENIRKSAEYIQNLANDLSALTQLEAGKIRLENHPFSINKLIEETASGIAAIHTDKDVRLVLQPDPALDMLILSDPYRIRQIISNLISNAFKFTLHGSVRVQSKKLDDAFLEIKVIDTGIGIEKNSLDIIFKEFTQANASIEKRFGGTGLGLAISSRLAQLLGGSIKVESKPGEGSTFSLRLPFNAGPKKAEKSNTSLSGKSAVVIDDDENLLHLISEVLHKGNVSVRGFLSASDALVEIENNTPDMVLTDIQMPEMSGLDLIRAIRQKKLNVPTMALSGAELDRKTLEEAGFSGLIRKPFSLNGLKQSLEKCLSTPQEFTETVLEQSLSEPYDLKSVEAFLGNERATVYEFLKNMQQGTLADLEQLRSFIANQDIDAIRRLSHKMLSVFRQIHHLEITALLKNLEATDVVTSETENNFVLLQKSTVAFFDEILQNYRSRP